MGLRPFQSSIIVLGGMALIAVGSMLIRFQSRRDDNLNIEVIRSECNRGSIIPSRYRDDAVKIRNLLKSGKIDRWRDIRFTSGEHNEGIYLPHPNAKLNKDGLRINVVSMYYKESKTLEMNMPVLEVKGSVMSLSAPKYRYLSCLHLFKNDFIDYF